MTKFCSTNFSQRFRDVGIYLEELDTGSYKDLLVLADLVLYPLLEVEVLPESTRHIVLILQPI